MRSVNLHGFAHLALATPQVLGHQFLTKGGGHRVGGRKHVHIVWSADAAQFLAWRVGLGHEPATRVVAPAQAGQSVRTETHAYEPKLSIDIADHLPDTSRTTLDRRTLLAYRDGARLHMGTQPG